MEAACKKLNALEKKGRSGITAVLRGFGEYPSGQNTAWYFGKVFYEEKIKTA